MDFSRFSFYRSIVARFAGTTHCGHAMKPGDVVGHNRYLHRTKCADCWRAWQQENAEADAYESGLLN